MAAANYDILIEQGATFKLMLRWKDSEGDPIDLTGYAARMQVRPFVLSDEVLLSLTDDSDGGITLGGVEGTIEIEAEADQTELIGSRKGVYDLELVTPQDDVIRLVQGTVQISPEVTRDD